MLLSKVHVVRGGAIPRKLLLSRVIHAATKVTYRCGGAMSPVQVSTLVPTWRRGDHFGAANGYLFTRRSTRVAGVHGTKGTSQIGIPLQRGVHV